MWAAFAGSSAVPSSGGSLRSSDYIYIESDLSVLLATATVKWAETGQVCSEYLVLHSTLDNICARQSQKGRRENGKEGLGKERRGMIVNKRRGKPKMCMYKYIWTKMEWPMTRKPTKSGIPDGKETQ
ncbi:hypothetical protein FIBSPDRAFT_279133 [Athelia psychrophila]|uniref:Uncharacterized protein n=1 Tax=Athelia psychrophila TaxID=1759441 RepID=A0A165WKS2_9AGAM|nr:hypothetical protein FIBSPDRAFT_279133 [Fibularhizoctonia sp. CBS 109695]